MIPLVSLKKKQIVCLVFWDFLFFFPPQKGKRKKSSLEKIPERSLPIEKYISRSHCSVIFYGNSFLIYENVLLSLIFEKAIPEQIFFFRVYKLGKEILFYKIVSLGELCLDECLSSGRVGVSCARLPWWIC